MCVIGMVWFNRQGLVNLRLIFQFDSNPSNSVPNIFQLLSKLPLRCSTYPHSLFNLSFVLVASITIQAFNLMYVYESQP